VASPECTECRELRRQVVSAKVDYEQLIGRTRGRHPSRAERRRLVQLRTMSDHALHELVHHQNTHKETP